MTTIITRLYQDMATAEAIASQLSDAGHPANNFDVIAQGDNLHAALGDAGVPEGSAAKYAPMIEGGNVLVVMRAPFVPFGAARSAMQIMDTHNPIDAGVANENVYIEPAIPGSHAPSVLQDHPLFFTTPRKPGDPARRLFSEAMGFKLLSERRPRRSAMSGGGHMSTRFLPFPLLRKGHRKSSVSSRGGPVSTRILPYKLLDTEPRRNTLKDQHGPAFSELFGLKLLSKR